MTDLLTAIGWLFSNAWDFFTEINVPGIGVSFAALFVALFLASLGLRLFLMVLNGSSDAGGFSIFRRKKDDK